jgi:hypothetical protein
MMKFQTNHSLLATSLFIPQVLHSQVNHQTFACVVALTGVPFSFLSSLVLQIQSSTQVRRFPENFVEYFEPVTLMPSFQPQSWNAICHALKNFTQ